MADSVCALSPGTRGHGRVLMAAQSRLLLLLEGEGRERLGRVDIVRCEAARVRHVGGGCIGALDEHGEVGERLSVRGGLRREAVLTESVGTVVTVGVGVVVGMRHWRCLRVS